MRNRLRVYSGEWFFWSVKIKIICAFLFVKVDPVSALRNDSKVIDFLLPNSANAVWDLANCHFRVDMKITDKDGKDVQRYHLNRFDLRTRQGTEEDKDADKENESTENSDDTTDFSDEPEPWKNVDPVACSNNALASLFEKVEACVNDCVVNSSDNNHVLKSFVQNSLNYSKDSKNSILSVSGYHADTIHPSTTQFRSNGGMALRAR